MLAFALLCGLAIKPDGLDAKVDYEARRATTPRDAGSQVALALWCESRGLTKERARHLAMAALADPENALARTLMGLVKDGDAWRPAQDIARRAAEDTGRAALLAEYRGRRDAMKDTADDHAKLARWCESGGLADEATAHWRAVVRIDPLRDAAWKKLGCKKVDGRWLTDAQADAAKAEAQARKAADRDWAPRLSDWKNGLTSRDPARKAEAERALADVSDPYAIPAIYRTFFAAQEADPIRGVRLLGQIDGPEASRALVSLAISHTSDDVRSAAASALKGRDPREFVEPLVALLRDPIKYEVKKVGGPGEPGMLYVRGERFDTRRTYDAPMPDLRLGPLDEIGIDADGQPTISRDMGLIGRLPIASAARQAPGIAAARLAAGERVGSPLGATGARLLGQGLANDTSFYPFGVDPRNLPTGVNARRVDYQQRMQATVSVPQILAEAERAAISAQEQLERDRAAIVAINDRIRESNNRAKLVLIGIAGEDLGPTRERWVAWSTDMRGYVYRPKPNPRLPIVDEVVPPSYVPTVQIDLDRVNRAVLTHSCFAAGTPVLTAEGSRPIESVRTGDRILVQDTDSGSLRYRPVVTAYHNPPNETLRIRVGDDTIVATPIHRFWKAGQGWTMARELKAGDRVRTLDGVGTVEAVEPGEVQPVFNLEVASGESFFVGNRPILVHDNTIIRPVARPFDAVAAAGKDR